MDQQYEHEQSRPLLTGSPPPRAYETTPNNASVIASEAIGYHPEYETDSDDDDEIGPPKIPAWKAWLHTIFKFFQGLGKFFLILALGTIVLIVVLQYTLPSVDEEHRKDIHFPHSLEDLEALRKILIASAVGATNCYLLSRLFFSKLVKRKFGERMEKWNTQLEKHRNDLISYIILLRLAPFPPNWFVNICSPHLHVPLWPEFFIGTLIGVTAPSVVHVQAGMVLEKLVEDHTSGVDIFTLKNIGMLVAVALLAALPVLIRWILARREARKVGIHVDALGHEEEGEINPNDLNPILEPLDPTGLIISPERQHFLRRSSSSFSRTGQQQHLQSHPQQQPQQQEQYQQQ
ncbi:Transmembrane protein 41B [Entomortierella chlamydospora]|uniref:Transmembrane protein 41B n=1 Tax=Entomortierella chlamydospora TaxID=101097 RepID=A0A9P6T485_9FUNG|nr:Transmembrane protein 41B [Entomortierella chlamydospora]